METGDRDTITHREPALVVLGRSATLDAAMAAEGGQKTNTTPVAPMAPLVTTKSSHGWVVGSNLGAVTRAGIFPDMQNTGDNYVVGTQSST